jgi:hypothetical protein
MLSPLKITVSPESGSIHCCIREDDFLGTTARSFYQYKDFYVTECLLNHAIHD